MAKATKAADKKSSKTASKAPPPKTAKAAPKAAVKAAVKAVAKPAAPAKPAGRNGKSSEPPKAARVVMPEIKEAKAPKSEAKPEQKIDPSQLRAHPDAKLSPKEVGQLYTKLQGERQRVIGGFEKHVQEALSDDDVLADEIDIAQRSTDQAWLFRFADKERKLLIEIDAAIEKMKNGEYGICEGTDEAIGFKRLELRPWTRYSVAYKEMLEREKAQQAR